MSGFLHLTSASQNTCEGDIITPISQMRKVRCRGPSSLRSHSGEAKEQGEVSGCGRCA